MARAKSTRRRGLGRVGPGGTNEGSGQGRTSTREPLAEQGGLGVEEGRCLLQLARPGGTRQDHAIGPLDPGRGRVARLAIEPAGEGTGTLGGEVAVQEDERLQGVRADAPLGQAVWVSGASKASNIG